MIQRWRTNWKLTHKRLLVHAWFTLLVLRIGDFQENYPIRGLERTRKFFLVLKSLVPTQSSQDEEKFSCPFESTDNFPEPFHIPITCHIIFSLLYGYKFWTVNLKFHWHILDCVIVWTTVCLQLQLINFGILWISWLILAGLVLNLLCKL
jgi:hypothetical protein